MKQLFETILVCAHTFICVRFKCIDFFRGRQGVYMDFGEWEGVFGVNENHWLEFWSSVNVSFAWKGTPGISGAWWTGSYWEKGSRNCDFIKATWHSTEESKLLQPFSEMIATVPLKSEHVVNVWFYQREMKTDIHTEDFYMKVQSSIVHNSQQHKYPSIGQQW